MEEFEITKKHLNKKKIIIFVFSILLLVCSILFLIIKLKNQDKINSKKFNQTFRVDNIYEISFTNSFPLIKKQNSNNKFILELCSENNLNIYISKLENLENNSLYMITKSDISDFTPKFEQVSNISKVEQVNTEQLEAYTYNFEYLDTINNIPYYLQTFFVRIKNQTYSIDIDLPLSQKDNVLPSIIRSILEIKTIN